MRFGLSRRSRRFASVASTLLCAVAGASESIDSVQRAAGEWARLRAETSRLQFEWTAQREALEGSMQALQARLDGLVRERDSLDAELRRETAQSAGGDENNTRAREALGSIVPRVDALARRLVAARPYLPPRLSSGLELPYRSLEDPALGPSERIQHLITIVNRCMAFNRAFTLGEQELQPDGEGPTRLMEVLHAGMSHAYAYDRTREGAYFGHPGPGGWVWEPAGDAAPAIAKLFAVFREQTDPVFAFVPVQVHDLEPARVTEP